MPADQAGLLGHDVLHKLDDQLLINRAQLAVLVRTYKPDYEIKLTVIRKGLSRTIQATLAVTMLPVLGPSGKRSSTSWEEDYLKIRPRFLRGHKDAHSKIFNEENNRRVDNFLHDSSRKLAYSVATPRKHSTTSNPSFARSGTRPHQQCERSAANYISSRTDLTPEFDDDKISLTCKDDERFIHLGRSAHGVWLITVTDVDGHVTKKIKYHDIDDLPESVRLKVQAILELMTGEMGGIAPDGRPIDAVTTAEKRREIPLPF